MTAASKKTRNAWLGLGGNIGDVRASMEAALERLDAMEGVSVSAVSHLYRTPPWGITDQPDFLNACAQLVTELPAEALLDACLDTERSLKRERTLRWGPRTIDIDLLAVEGVEQETEKLTLPHPRMLDRAFVLLPLADLAPGLIITDRPVTDWLADVDAAGVEKLADASDWWQMRKQKTLP